MNQSIFHLCHGYINYLEMIEVLMSVSLVWHQVNCNLVCGLCTLCVYHTIRLQMCVWFINMIFFFLNLKEVFSDSNIIVLWHYSEDINKRSLFPKFQVIPIWHFQVMRDHLCFIAPIDNCVELSLMDKTFCENCSHFILKWLQHNSFGEMCF